MAGEPLVEFASNQMFTVGFAMVIIGIGMVSIGLVINVFSSQ
jgi:hypothetical protein